MKYHEIIEGQLRAAGFEVDGRIVFDAALHPYHLVRAKRDGLTFVALGPDPWPVYHAIEKMIVEQQEGVTQL